MKLFPEEVYNAVWSPCNKFIAICWRYFSGIVILDAVTLGQLYTMYSQHRSSFWPQIVFSPDSCVLTGYSTGQSSSEYCITSWDLQTGDQISSISTAELGYCYSIVYSGSGAIIGALFSGNTIITYDVPSGIQMFSHPTQQSSIEAIWTHGEHIQFATIDLDSIITWQISFTSNHPPTKVSSLPTPHGLSQEFVLQPTISRLASIFGEEVLVWDTQNHKILLEFRDDTIGWPMTFSSDGHLSMCKLGDLGFCIWKESLDGYLLHQQFTSSSKFTALAVSPNGKSVISFGGSMLQLWPIASSSTQAPIAPMQASRKTELLLEFSLNESLVAFAKHIHRTVTVLDTSSGSPLLVIDADMNIYGMKITNSQIIIVGNRNIVTWNMPTRDCVLDIKRSTSDSIQITRLKGIDPFQNLTASISSDLNYIAMVGYTTSTEDGVGIYSMHTGEKLTAAKAHRRWIGWTPDQLQLWCGSEGITELELWALVVESGSNAIKLERLPTSTKPPSSLPWNSPHGYQVTDDGWILSPTGMHLMWLPYHWQTRYKVQKFWSKKLLVLHYENLSEPLILRFED